MAEGVPQVVDGKYDNDLRESLCFEFVENEDGG